MRDFRGLTGAIAVATLLSTMVFAPAAVKPVRPDSDAVDALVADHIGVMALPGVAVAITRFDEVVHVGGYGHDATGASIDGDTLMRIGSVSKSFTALAVMQLVDAGEVDLDAPVTDYLPDFGMADERAVKITVRQLLDHTSGMSDSTHPEAGMAQPASPAEAVERLSKVGLATEPGEVYQYHNVNYQVAARVAEVVSGLSFDRYLSERVFSPAGMDSSLGVDNLLEPVPGLADGHNRFLGFNTVRAESDRFVAGSAGIVSSANDLAAWLMIHQNGGVAPNGRVIASSRAIDAMHAASGPGTDTGLGLSRSVYGVPDRLGHNGTTFTYTA